MKIVIFTITMLWLIPSYAGHLVEEFNCLASLTSVGAQFREYDSDRGIFGTIGEFNGEQGIYLFNRHTAQFIPLGDNTSYEESDGNDQFLKVWNFNIEFDGMRFPLTVMQQRSYPGEPVDTSFTLNRNRRPPGAGAGFRSSPILEAHGTSVLGPQEEELIRGQVAQAVSKMPAKYNTNLQYQNMFSGRRNQITRSPQSNPPQFYTRGQWAGAVRECRDAGGEIELAADQAISEIQGSPTGPAESRDGNDRRSIFR